jgi:hypothetical protein
MPIVVREVELSLPIAGFEGLQRYARAMVVLRWRGRVVGRTFADITTGRIEVGLLERAIAGALTGTAWQAWLDDIVGYDERQVTGTAQPTATVAICTGDRETDLEPTLAAVAAVEGRGNDLLVVDSGNSSEATRRVVQRFSRVRYVREPRRGPNVSRNRALREARGEVVAFASCDSTPEPDWLCALLANFGDPRVLGVTGLILPRELPGESQDAFDGGPADGAFDRRVYDGLRDNVRHIRLIGSAANMAVRRSVLARVGAFDERLDCGATASHGGHRDLFAQILSSGHRLVYDPSAVSWRQPS